MPQPDANDGTGGIARSGAAVWDAFVELAGLEPDTVYDRDLCDGVARRLKLGWGRDIGEEIERAGIDPTTVLVEVLGALEPWSQMMRDLLELLHGCGATETRTQLRADVDIESASEQLELDLTSFTEAIESYEELVGSASRPTWSVGALRVLWELLPNVDDHAPLREEVQRWLRAYEPEADFTLPHTPWPEPPLEPPISGDRELDRALAVAWRGWAEVIRIAASGAPSRRALFERRMELRDSEPPSADAAPTLAWVAVVDHDRFPAFVAAGLDELARRVREGDRSPWRSGMRGEHSPRDLIDLVGSLPETLDEPALSSRLREVLSLPVWKHRYDIYSNWVFAAIVAALRERIELTVHHESGRIDFGFAATRLASCPERKLAVFCELRSPLAAPSPKRKHDVQPDYSILIGDEGEPAASSVVEVECKQYRRAGRRSYAVALQDYARARPAAEVILASYGNVSERVRAGILADVDESVRDRCQVHGDLRPGAGGGPAAFAAAVLEGAGLVAAAGGLRTDVPMRIELHWDRGSIRTDLDLHLEIVGDERHCVGFRSPKAGDPDPHALLVDDVTEGGGTEILRIERWVDAVYRLSVHRYAGADLDRCRPRIVLVGGEREDEIPCPAGRGDWWRVLELDARTGTMEVIGRREE